MLYVKEEKVSFFEAILDWFKRPFRREGLSRKEKALLELLIAEIKDALPDVKRVEELLDSWVKANDLHPERVERIALK